MIRSRGYLSSDPAHWLSQDPPRRGTIDTPPDTISTAFDPPGGDFHFKPSAHYSCTLSRRTAQPTWEPVTQHRFLIRWASLLIESCRDTASFIETMDDSRRAPYPKPMGMADRICLEHPGWGFRIGVPGMRSRNAKRNAELCVSRAFPFRVPRSVNLASQSPPNTLLPGAGLRRQFVSIHFSIAKKF